MYFYPRAVYTKLSSRGEQESKETFSTTDSSSLEDLETAADVASRRLKWAFIYISAVSLVIPAFALAATALFAHQCRSCSPSAPSPSPSTNISHGIPAPEFDCGWSPAEARAKGCKFDVVTTSWMPEACSTDYTSEYVSTSDDGQGYQFFTDKSGTRPITPNELREYDYTMRFWSTKKWHLTHCLFIFKRFYDAVEKGKRITTHEQEMEHADHCVGLILEALEYAPGWEDINAYGVVQFLEC
ncbi:hypothetical protein MMC10_005894 [Thelotrema lepadinum]|nr:hypothetical protein [Thelotrema lepadinum]